MSSMEAGMPRTLGELVDAVRGGLVCERCGRYIGSLGSNRYLPAPYPVAVGSVGPDDEASALAAFEWYMLGRLRVDNFVIRHPEIDGRCVSMREWLAAESTEDDET
jgi:hypothetical protein